MPSLMSEHAVVSLVRQCFVTPRCQGTRMRRSLFSKSSTRPYHRLRTCRAPPRVEVSQLKQPHRCYTQHDTGGSNGIYSLSKLSKTSAGLGGLGALNTLCTQRRHNSTRHLPPTKHIAVLGGGITGLTSAHYLALNLPDAKITIYDSADRLGGWLQSKYVDVKDGKILFEAGPRTLRPNTDPGLVTLEMVYSLTFSFNWC